MRGIRLRKRFEELARLLFPRWKSERWSIQTSNGPSRCVGASGYCDRTHRAIYVYDGKDVTLAHEICHAVSTGGHGEPFLRALRQSAAKARAAGLTTLANELDAEVTGYEQARAERPTAADMYLDLHEAADDLPLAYPSSLIRAVARNHGYTASEFRKRYRRADAVAKSAWAKANERRKRSAERRQQLQRAAAGKEKS